MRTKKVIKFNNIEYKVGEIVYFENHGFAKIEKISFVSCLEEAPFLLDVTCIYDETGKPCEHKFSVSIECIKKAAPFLRKRINALIDEEERLQNILSQCQKEV